MPRKAAPAAPRHSQRGVVLILSLIILVVLLGASAALVRSFDTSLFVAGNLAFKRDLVNQAERAVPDIVIALRTGPLSTPLARGADNPGFNYSARVLQTNVQGIPLALLQTTGAFDALGFATSGNDIAFAGQGVTVRYVMDRMCTELGDESSILDRCVTSTPEPPTAGDNADRQRAEQAGGGSSSPIAQQVVYRLSLRVDGPRDTQAFLQTTFTR